MDNDVCTCATTTNRQARQRRRVIAGAVAAVVVVSAVVVGGTWQHSKAGTSGALGLRACPTINATTHRPSITPAPEVDWSACLNLVSGADLAGANLVLANLESTYLGGATLTGANLVEAIMIKTYLSGAILDGAHLSGANLEGADLTRAWLIGSDLTDADLIGTNLKGATLRDTTMTGVGYGNTTCPNGNNSDNFGGTCAGQGMYLLRPGHTRAAPTSCVRVTAPRHVDDHAAHPGRSDDYRASCTRPSRW